MKLHETTRISSKDEYFVVGGNPDGNGGGVIGSAKTFSEAQKLQVEALKQNYTNVRILDWMELTVG
jgi:hypothetical protein